MADGPPPDETHPWDPSVAATQVRASPETNSEVSRELLFATVTPEAEGRYQLLTELGRGGIGRVVAGYDMHLGRTVAYKELMLAYSATGLSGSERDPSVLRFLREARVTGQLEHPSIVPVYELGHRSDGTIYYTMKRVRGRTLGKALSETEGLQSRLLFLPSLLDVANAIAYAHSRGVIHRDIKPDNVMLGEFGETVVLDWGLTKVRGEEDLVGNTIPGRAKSPNSMDGLSNSSTLDGEIMGTPAYMSPEQAEGSIERVDERSDVWSLGAVLFEMLTGRAPFNEANAEQTLLVVAEGVIPDIRVLEPKAPRDLTAIAVKAMARRPVDRYADASGFVRDLQAFLSGARVSAYEYSAWELLRKFFREHQAVALGILGVLLATMVGGAATYMAYREAVQERAKAVAAEGLAVANAHDADSHLAMGYLQRAEVLHAEKRLGEAGLFASAALLSHPNPAARGVAMRSALFEVESQRGLRLDSHVDLSVGCELDVLKDTALVSTRAGLQVVDLKTGSAGAVVPTDGCATLLAIAPSGEWAFVRGADLRLRRFDIEEARLSPRLESLEPVAGVAIAPGDETCWLALGKDSLQQRRTSDLALLRRFSVRDPRRVELSPDGRTVAIGTRWGRLELRDTSSGRILRRFHDLESTIWAIDFSEDGRRVAFGGYDGVAVIRSVEEGGPPLLVQVGALMRSLFLDDRGLVVGSTDGGSVWSTESGELLERFRVDARGADQVAGRDSGRFVSVGDGPGLETWRLEPSSKTLQLPQADVLRHVVDRSGRWVFTLDRDARLQAWRDGRLQWTRAEPTGWQLHVLEDPVRVLSLASNGALTMWSQDGRKQVLQPPTGKRPLSQTDLDSFGARLAWTGDEGRVFVLDPDGTRSVLGGLEGLVTSVAFGKEGRRLLAGDQHGSLSAWEVSEGRQVWSKPPSRAGISSSLDVQGDEVVAAWSSGRVALLDVESGELIREFPHPDFVNVASLGPRWILTGADDGKARVWERESGQLLLILDTEDVVTSIDFTDGGQSFAVDEKRTVRFYPTKSDALNAPAEELMRQAEQRSGLGLDGFETRPLWEME